MKKLLIATTALVATAGIASAEVTLSGTGKMGIYQSGAGYNGNTNWNFRSGINVTVGLKGESDSGLSFGGSFSMSSLDTTTSSIARPDNGGAGTLWVSGAFGKLTMGAVDSAAQATVGNVSGVGLWSDNGHKVAYMGGGADYQNPGALYQYDNNGMSFAVSMLDGAPDSRWSAAAGYTMGDYKMTIGYEEMGASSAWFLGGNATFGAATVKARYGSHNEATDWNEYALSVDYKAGAATVTAYYHDDSQAGAIEDYGIGASYDLGGGASVVGGWSSKNAVDTASLGLKIAF